MSETLAYLEVAVGDINNFNHKCDRPPPAWANRPRWPAPLCDEPHHLAHFYFRGGPPSARIDPGTQFPPWDTRYIVADCRT